MQVLCHVCCDHVLSHRQGAWLLDKLHTHNPAGTAGPHAWGQCLTHVWKAQVIALPQLARTCFFPEHHLHAADGMLM